MPTPQDVESLVKALEEHAHTRAMAGDTGALPPWVSTLIQYLPQILALVLTIFGQQPTPPPAQ